MRGWVVVPYADAPIDLSPLGVPKPPVWVARVRTGQAPDYVGSPDVSLVAGPSDEWGRPQRRRTRLIKAAKGPSDEYGLH
jgi:hypothetical protein